MNAITIHPEGAPATRPAPRASHAARAARRRRGGLARRLAWTLAALLGVGGGALAAEGEVVHGDEDAAAASVAVARDGALSGATVDAAAREAGKLALEAASDEKQAAYDLEGDAREAALIDAARTYGVVADEPTFGLDERAEAAFRAGEILRARGRVDEAVQHFAQAADLGRRAEQGKAREFAARGILEQAHAVRRDEREADAVGLYLRVGAEFPDQGRIVGQAKTWAIKLLVRLERLEEAGTLAAGFATSHPDQPIESVRAVEEWVDGLLEAGRSEEAVAAVDGLQVDLARTLTGDDEKMASRVTDALAGLRVTVSTSGH